MGWRRCCSGWLCTYMCAWLNRRCFGVARCSRMYASAVVRACLCVHARGGACTMCECTYAWGGGGRRDQRQRRPTCDMCHQMETTKMFAPVVLIGGLISMSHQLLCIGSATCAASACPMFRGIGYAPSTITKLAYPPPTTTHHTHTHSPPTAPHRRLLRVS